MNVSRVFLNSAAFFSGCFPIALINFIINIFLRTEGNNWYVEIFAKSLLIITVLASLFFYIYLRKKFRSAVTTVEIKDIKRKDIFSSGAISYYILPFVSFVGNDEKSMVTLVVVLTLLVIIFNNNLMFLYTPLIDMLGYKILEGKILYSNSNLDVTKIEIGNILVKSDKKIFFSKENKAHIHKISEGIFCAIIIEN
jgi:hypothetical protein